MKVYKSYFSNQTTDISQSALWTFTCPSLHEKDPGDRQEVGATQQKFLSALHAAGSDTDGLDDRQLLGRALGCGRENQQIRTSRMTLK